MVVSACVAAVLHTKMMMLLLVSPMLRMHHHSPAMQQRQYVPHRNNAPTQVNATVTLCSVPLARVVSRLVELQPNMMSLLMVLPMLMVHHSCV
jgi:hypothetical protein